MDTPKAVLPAELMQYRETVQHNCHISDARFAGDYTMCVYLLKMREYFRWEKGYGYGKALPNKDLSDWLSAREELWGSLEDASFSPIAIDGREYDPFDADAINAALKSHRLLYSAGYGNKAKPHFFLARLEKTIEEEGYRIHVSAEEYARDLSAPPAMSLGEDIFIRRESLRRMLWEKLEEWRWNRPDNAMGRAIRYYGFDADLDAALEEMTEAEIESLVLHEIGEVEAGELLGDNWREMFQSFPRSRLELMARAVRDHLADSLSTLPALLERNQASSLHFYFANLSGMRKQIYPALIDAYNHWVAYNDMSRLKNLTETGRQHWLQVARELLQLHESRIKTAWQEMETLIEQKQL
jgi:hypothetical protein